MSKYTLFYAPGTCSMAVHVALHEMNADFQIEQVEIHGTKSPSLLAVNPRGQVPVLVTEGTPITEGGAILTYLCDTEKSSLLPSSGLPRAKALEALMFCNSSLHPAYGAMFYLKMTGKSESDEMKNAVTRIQGMWDFVESKLTKQAYLAGDSLTVGDLLLAVIANWSGNSPIKINFGPKTTQLLKTVSSRPSFQTALSEEKVEYKAAA